MCVCVCVCVCPTPSVSFSIILGAWSWPSPLGCHTEALPTRRSIGLSNDGGVGEMDGTTGVGGGGNEGVDEEETVGEDGGTGE